MAEFLHRPWTPTPSWANTSITSNDWISEASTLCSLHCTRTIPMDNSGSENLLPAWEYFTPSFCAEWLWGSPRIRCPGCLSCSANRNLSQKHLQLGFRAPSGARTRTEDGQQMPSSRSSGCVLPYTEVGHAK